MLNFIIKKCKDLMPQPNTKVGTVVNYFYC